MLTWRSLYQSGRFDAAWKHVMARLKSTAGAQCQSANDNCEKTRRRRMNGANRIIYASFATKDSLPYAVSSLVGRKEG